MCSQISRVGATVQNLIDDVSLCDMKLFSTVIVYVSGNDAASGKGPEWIADKYDRLISLIICSNYDCRIILFSVVPRGDVDVTKMNQVISELATHWKKQRVECASECYVVFFNSRIPKPYLNIFKDGITYSGPIIWNSLPNEIKNCILQHTAYSHKML